MSKAAVQTDLPKPKVLALGQNSQGTFWAMIQTWVRDKETNRPVEKSQFLGSLEDWASELTPKELLPEAYVKYLRK